MPTIQSTFDATKSAASVCSIIFTQLPAFQTAFIAPNLSTKLEPVLKTNKSTFYATKSAASVNSFICSLDSTFNPTNRTSIIISFIAANNTTK